jgi:hypothetical protein
VYPEPNKIFSDETMNELFEYWKEETAYDIMQIKDEDEQLEKYVEWM